MLGVGVEMHGIVNLNMCVVVVVFCVCVFACVLDLVSRCVNSWGHGLWHRKARRKVQCTS